MERRLSTAEAIREAEELTYFRAREDLGLFTQAAWDVLEPKTALSWNWHHDYIAEHLQACELGQIKRLVINVKPRSMKSILTSVCFPDWVWTRAAHKRFLFGSYAEKLAVKHSILRRNLIASDWYQGGYGHLFRLARDMNTKAEIQNNRTGMMKASGINAVPLGQGGDYIVIDDPHDPKGAESDAQREEVLLNFDLGWQTRLNDKKTGVIIVIMQRLHQRDLTGHILDKELGYVHLKVPTVADERTTLVFPVTGRRLVREEGDLLDPERDGLAEIEATKRELGDYGWSGQHLQNPVAHGGNQFKEEMFTLGDPPADEEFLYRFITADTAYKEKEHNDWNVFSHWGLHRSGDLWLLGILRVKMKASEIEGPAKSFIVTQSRWGFVGAYIEPKGHGVYLNQKLPAEGVPIPPEPEIAAFFRDRSAPKVQRANFAIPYLAGHRVVFSSAIDEKTRHDIRLEALAFPNGKHDDFVDTLIDGIKRAYAHTPSILNAL